MGASETHSEAAKPGASKSITSPRLHNSYVQHINIPPGTYPPDPKHGEVTYVVSRNWCECDKLCDHASVIDLASTNRKTPRTDTNPPPSPPLH